MPPLETPLVRSVRIRPFKEVAEPRELVSPFDRRPLRETEGAVMRSPILRELGRVAIWDACRVVDRPSVLPRPLVSLPPLTVFVKRLESSPNPLEFGKLFVRSLTPKVLGRRKPFARALVRSPTPTELVRALVRSPTLKEFWLVRSPSRTEPGIKLVRPPNCNEFGRPLVRSPNLMVFGEVRLPIPIELDIPFVKSPTLIELGKPFVKAPVPKGLVKALDWPPLPKGFGAPVVNALLVGPGNVLVFKEFGGFKILI